MNKSSIVLEGVARDARVPEVNRPAFIRLLKHAVSRAHKDSSQASGKSISAGALTRDFFGPIARAAQKLRFELERLEGEHLVPGEAPRSMAASHFFSETVRRRVSESRASGDPRLHPINSLNLDLVIEVAERASAHAKSWLSKGGRKIGTGRPAFDICVMALLVASDHTGGRLTIYKTSYGEGPWAGSLLSAMHRLRPLLPKSNFWPSGKLGSSLHTVYQRWRREAGKPRRKQG